LDAGALGALMRTRLAVSPYLALGVRP
jgi:hypothetical protein